jgi:hypothetical protein
MNTPDQINSVWVFNGNGGRFPAAVFTTKELGEEWINSTGVHGILTQYPLDISAYDWCVAKGFFEPATEEQKQPTFIQQFSSAYQDHYHYEIEEEV